MKHNSPLQRHVFLPLTCRILKKKITFSLPFCHDWQRVQETIKLHLRNIKMIKGGTRNPYKCLNVMKQDAIDDKIIEICKTCENQCIPEGLDRSRRCRAAIEQKPISIDWESVEDLLTRQKISRWIKKLSRQCPETSIDRVCDNFYRERKSKGLDR